MSYRIAYEMICFISVIIPVIISIILLFALKNNKKYYALILIPIISGIVVFFMISYYAVEYLGYEKDTKIFFTLLFIEGLITPLLILSIVFLFKKKKRKIGAVFSVLTVSSLVLFIFLNSSVVEVGEYQYGKIDTIDIRHKLYDNATLEVPSVYHSQFLQLQNGTYFLLHSHPRDTVRFSYSLDGYNWSGGNPLFNSSETRYYPQIFQLDDGRLMCIYHTYDGGGNANHNWVTFSERDFIWTDSVMTSFEGSTDVWGYVKDITQDDTGVIYAISSGGDMITHVHRSTDGITWELHSETKGWYQTILATSDGGFVAVGENKDYDVRYFTSTDAKKWKDTSGIDDHFGSEIIETSNGNIMVAGFISQGGFDSEPPPGVGVFVKNNKDKWSTANEVALDVKSDDLFLFENNDSKLVICYYRFGTYNFIYFDYSQLVVE